MPNTAAPILDESRHDTENCPGGADCPYSCPIRPELAAWSLDEDADGDPYWWRPGTEHDALTLHHDDDDSEFGIVSASSAAEALRIDRETFGLSVDVAARICPVFRTITGA
jgi:hypothetical protein